MTCVMRVLPLDDWLERSFEWIVGRVATEQGTIQISTIDRYLAWKTSERMFSVSCKQDIELESINNDCNYESMMTHV
jgi:hypothetical protein